MPKTTKAFNNWGDLYETYDNKYGISKKEFRLILYTFNSLLLRDVIYKGVSYYLPEDCGVLTVLKKRTRRTGYFDYATFNKLGIRRFIKNNHSGGFKAQLHWIATPKTGAFPALISKLHQFKPTRYANREIAKAIKDHNTTSLYYDD